MSKLLSEIVVAAMLVSLTGNVQAQLPPTVNPTVKPTPTAKPTPLPSPSPSAIPTATTPDLKLLGKAMGLFWQGNRAQTESQIVMTLQRKGTNTNPVQINAAVKTIAQTGDRFRSELTVSRSGSPSKITYSIVCDGRNVWMYRPDKRQYSQLAFSEFKPQFYSLLVGLSTVFFVSMSEPDRKAVIANIAGGGSFLQAIPANEIASLQGNNRQIDGQNFYVYFFNNQQERSNFSGFVQPETGILKRVDFVSNTEEADINIVEKILTHTTTNNPSNKIFRFTPPSGVKKVKSISNDLLQLLE